MKNTSKLFGIIALVAMIGFSFAACDDGSGSGNGGGDPGGSDPGTTTGGNNNGGDNNGNNGEPAHEHDWGVWVVTTEPTFISEGEETRTCKKDSSYTETRAYGTSLPITTAAEWATARSQLNGKTGAYTLTISGNNIGVAGSTANSFGTTAEGNSLSVTLKGSGKLSLTTANQGYLLRIGARQTLIIDSESLTLAGRTGNNQSVVSVSADGILELKEGNISDNDTTSAGGGVTVSGTFIMNGGKISGNTTTSVGGGVYVNNNGSFTMHGGKISGNKTTTSGGGVYANATTTATIFIITGTIYGSNESDTTLRNTANSGGAALWVIGNSGEHGTFAGPGPNEGWTKKGDLTNDDNTIDVLNGNKL